MLPRFSIPMYSLTSNSTSEYSCLFHYNSCSIFTTHRPQFRGWLPVCPSVLAFLLHAHSSAKFELRASCYINTMLRYKTGWELGVGGGVLAFLWIHVNCEVLQAVSLLELSAVYRGVVSCSSEWPVTIVICIYLGFLRSLSDVHTWHIKSTECHVPEAIFSTVNRRWSSTKGDNFFDSVSDHQLLKGTAYKTTYVWKLPEWRLLK